MYADSTLCQSKISSTSERPKRVLVTVNRTGFPIARPISTPFECRAFKFVLFDLAFKPKYKVPELWEDAENLDERPEKFT